MTYAEISAAVFALTNRPDLVTETDTMIQAATLRMHQSDFYARDLFEQTVDLGAFGFAFSFALSPTFTRFRAMHYLRKYDSVTALAGVLLTQMDPKHVFDGYGVERNDVWYIAGANVVVRSGSSLRYMLAGWYQNPIITPIANYASWIADLVPHAIIFDACSLLFSMINQQEQSRKFDGLVKEQLGMVMMHGFDGKGY